MSLTGPDARIPDDLLSSAYTLQATVESWLGDEYLGEVPVEDGSVSWDATQQVQGSLIRALPEQIHGHLARRIRHQREALPAAHDRRGLHLDAARRRQPVPELRVDRRERVTDHTLLACACPDAGAGDPLEARRSDALDVACRARRRERRRDNDLDTRGLAVLDDRDRLAGHI